MPTRTPSLTVLVLAAGLALSACSTDPTPTAPVASGGASAPAASAPSASQAASAPSRPSASARAGSARPAASPRPSGPNSDPAVRVDRDAVLEVDDQRSEGPTVNVEAAAVSDGGWVVVASDGGRNVLGVGEVPSGTTPTLVQVSLADVITKDTELVARLYDDASGDGFYGAGDKPVSNDDEDEDDTAGGETEVFSFRGKDVVNSAPPL